MDNINNNNTNIHIDPNPRRKGKRKEAPLIKEVLSKNLSNKIEVVDREFFNNQDPSFDVCCFKVQEAKMIVDGFLEKIKLFQIHKIKWQEVQKRGVQVEEYLKKINSAFWNKILVGKEQELPYINLMNLFNETVLRFNAVCKK